MTANYYELIHDQLSRHADSELVIWPDEDRAKPASTAYTGGAILDRVAAIRTELARRNVQPGQPVMLGMPVTFDLICSLLAIMAHGAIPVLPPAAASLRTLLLLLRHGNIRAILTHRKPAPPLSWLLRLAGITPVCTENSPDAPGQWLPPQRVAPDQPALISHSSGSTGVAKSIRRSHRVLLAQHQALDEAFPFWPGQRDFPLFPNILLHNLALGTVSILPALPGFKLAALEPVRIVQQIVDQHVQTMTGNVYYYQSLLRYLQTHPQTFPDVRAVGIGGSPVPEGLVHLLKTHFVQATIYIIYGSSEAEPIAVRAVGPEPLNPRAGYTVGAIHPSLQVAIRPMGTLVFTDGTAQAVGEITVKGPHVTVADLDWLLTGDFGYLNDADELVLTGRRGNERVHRGVQHYQVEHVLAHVAGVERVAALATERGFTVYIQGKAAETDLLIALSANFPEGLINHLYFRPTLPVDARHLSKIRYDQLRKSIVVSQ